MNTISLKLVPFYSDFIPGIFLVFTIAAAAHFLAGHYQAPVMLFALLLGMAFHFLAEDRKCKIGVEFAASRLLKIGVVLLGSRITLTQVKSLGSTPLLLIPIIVVMVIGSGLLLARLFRQDWAFGLLSGGAVAICGASAGLAIASVLPKTEQLQQQTLLVVIAVTSLSTLAMIIYPLVYAQFSLQDYQTGLLLGTTIHDVAQVVGAGYAVSNEAGDTAIYAKLLRVAMLPVVVIAIAASVRCKASASSSFPWFVVAFVLLLLVNSVGFVPEAVSTQMEWLSRWFLVIAISALGVKTSFEAMLGIEKKYIIIVVAETAFLFILASGLLLFI